MNIERTAVTSSNIRSVGYDPARQIMHVEFHQNGGYGGRLYAYHGVTPAEHAGLMDAESKGTHFAATLKPKGHSYKFLGQTPR